MVLITPQIKKYLDKNRVHPREPYYDVLMRLLGLGGEGAEVSGASASSNSEGSS